MEEITETTEQQESLAQRPRRHRKAAPVQDTIFKIRQILNILFMVLGVVAAVMYSGWVGDGVIVQMGAVLAVIAISLKMAECVLRYKKPIEDE